MAILSNSASSQTIEAPAKKINKCELSGTLSQHIRGRVTLHDNKEFLAWFILNHKVTDGNTGGLLTRTNYIPFLGLELRIDHDGSIGRINGSVYYPEIWSESQNKYVTDWTHTFSFGDLTLKNAPINMLLMSKSGEHQNHKTRLGIGAEGGGVDTILPKLKEGATFKSRAVNTNVPSEFLESTIDMSDVPSALVNMQKGLEQLQQQAKSGECLPQ